jgi:hypothetical protein
VVNRIKAMKVASIYTSLLLKTGRLTDHMKCTGCSQRPPDSLGHKLTTSLR